MKTKQIKKPDLKSVDLKWTPWKLQMQGGDQFVIRRYHYIVGGGGKKISQTMPSSRYKGKTLEQVQLMLKREAATYEQKRAQAEARYDFDHAYFSKQILEDFKAEVAHRSTDRDYQNSAITYLTKHVLEYFVRQKKLTNPIDWEKHQYAFGEWMLSNGYGPNTIKRANIHCNHLLRFLHKRFEKEVPQVVLQFIAPAKVKAINAQAKLDGEKVGEFIQERHFNLIVRYAGDIRQHVELGYWFGARRAEVVGLKLEDVFEDNLAIKRQLENFGEEPLYVPTKNRSEREVPYWFTTPELAYEAISNMKLMHPDSLSDRFAEVIKAINEREKLHLTYTFHDLRRTFITRAVRQYSLVDASRAAGHSDLRTTQKYLQDDRQLSKKRFVPTAARDIITTGRRPDGI